MMDLLKLSGRPKDKFVQLAKEVAKVKVDKLIYPRFWSEKRDGNFCITLKHQGEIGIFSRTGEVYTSMKHIEAELNIMMDNDTLIIFEAYMENTAQSVISGHCRDTQEQFPELEARCHDLITLDEFINGGTTEYQIRNLALNELFSGYPEPVHCSVIKQYRVDSMEIAMELTKDVWKQGREGGVLRNPLGLYAGGLGCPVVGIKRNDDIIKLKQSVTYDLEVVGMLVGKKGKYSATLGTLTAKWKDGKTLPVSGMTNIQRDEWWNNPELIIGKIIEIKAMRDSSKGSLREARFKSVRFDKLVGDF